jgi:hypothetical protein
LLKQIMLKGLVSGKSALLTSIRISIVFNFA